MNQNQIVISKNFLHTNGIISILTLNPLLKNGYNNVFIIYNTSETVHTDDRTGTPIITPAGLKEGVIHGGQI